MCQHDMTGQRWGQDSQAGWLAPEPGFSIPREEETEYQGNSKEGGKHPSGETKLGFLAKKALRLLCEGDE